MAIAKHISDADLDELRASSFLSKVSTGVDGQGCYLWTGPRNRKGYGRFRHGGSHLMAHRIAFAIGHNTPLPSVVMVCHRCDTPACCNPAHLFIGLALDNNRDAAEKGRQRTPRGQSNGNGKLTDDQVKAIVASDKAGVDLAREFGVSQALISMIRSGKRRGGG